MHKTNFFSDGFFKTWITLAVVFKCVLLQGQTGTYDQVYNLLQSKCSGCHNASANSGLLDLTGSSAAVYSRIVNKNPVNPVALAKGNKRVDPGYPQRSFLLRKCINELDPDLKLKNGEGNAMPTAPNPPLDNKEIELVRQWILHGAPQTGTVVDTAVINAYYRGKGINGLTKALPAPDSTQGFQIHLGKIFVNKDSEVEWFIKYNPKLPADVEIKRLEIATVPQSHHFVIYKYFTGMDKNFKEGLRDTSLSSHGSADIAVIFSPKTKAINLPVNTAYLWTKTEVLDLNYHLYNTNKDSVLAVDMYLNVYTQPVGTAKNIMYTKYFANLSISIPQDTTKTYTFASEAFDSSATNLWKVWMLYTHTHKYGKDYDIYLKKPDGTKGTQVYEGFYDFDYTFNQGYYATGVEAAQRTIYPFLEVDPRNGFIHEAVFQNTAGPDPVGFGLTSKDEMMVMIMQYILSDPLSVEERKPDNPIRLKAYPNPYTDVTHISYQLKERSYVRIEIYTLLGKKITTLADEVQDNSNHSYDFGAKQLGLAPGAYILAITVNGQTYAHKLIEF